MKRILVGVKRAVDYNVRIRVRSDGTGVETDGVKMSINPFDENALEEALRLKENGNAEEVLIVSVGPQEAEQQLRTGLAMGADRAILVRSDDDISPRGVAKTMLEIVKREAIDLVILGKQAIDGDNSQTGQMLAALWDRPQATFASKVLVNGDAARVTREVDAGLEEIEIDLPAVITVDLRLNEPRYVKLPDIMKAKKKPLDTLGITELGVETGEGYTVGSYMVPETRSKGIVAENVAGVVDALRDRGVI